MLRPISILAYTDVQSCPYTYAHTYSHAHAHTFRSMYAQADGQDICSALQGKLSGRQCGRGNSHQAGAQVQRLHIHLAESCPAGAVGE